MKIPLIRPIILTALLVIMGSPAVVSAEPVNRTVVDMLHISGSTENEGTELDPLLLSIKLQRELERSGKLDITPRSRAFVEPESRELSDNAKYSAIDAALIGQATGNQQVVQGFLRYFGTQAWVVIGLFDVRTKTKIKEVGAFCDNTGRNVIDRVIPDLARQLVGLKAETPAAAPIQAAPAIKAKSNYLKWTFLGIILASSVVFLERLTSQDEATPAPAEDRVEMVLQW